MGKAIISNCLNVFRNRKLKSLLLNKDFNTSFLKTLETELPIIFTGVDNSLYDKEQNPTKVNEKKEAKKTGIAC